MFRYATLLLVLSGVACASHSLRGGNNSTGAHTHEHRRLETLTIRPYDENRHITLGGPYSSGRLDLLVQSGSVTPGIITSVYLANGQGRSGDGSLGNQDEIDLEWRGNMPTTVQTNVFFSGQEDLQVIDVGSDTSKSMIPYGIEWDQTSVKFYVNGGLSRTKMLTRPLQPMSLQISLWSTVGGWPGLQQWAGGPPDWNSRGGQPVTAQVNIVNFRPSTSTPTTPSATTTTPSSSSSSSSVADIFNIGG